MILKFKEDMEKMTIFVLTDLNISFAGYCDNLADFFIGFFG